ncbi:MAG: adenylosuccinate synthase [Salinispira sp.]
MNIVIIGAQWGDEGKGKMVDFLSVHADIVIRFSGGANAGHTIVNNNTTYKFHLLPSGILYENTTVVLGSGMVIDLEALFAELDEIKKQGIEWKGRVFISNRAHIVLPGYKKKDIELEKERKNPIGTTGRGIGVAYSMKAGRDGLRVVDVLDPDRLQAFADDDRRYLAQFTDLLKEMTFDISTFIRKNTSSQILLEGAQGALLDIDLGTYPFVSSGCSTAAGASLGAGIGPKQLDKIYGVFKAYSTRVGNGPFPTEFREEFDGNMEDLVRRLGHEYGATTGRPRRCGHLDLVALRYAVLVNSFDALILTHIDVYDQFDEIYACVAYDIDGRRTKEFPASISDLERARPVLQSFRGWKTDITAIREYQDFPAAVQNYITYIENFCENPVEIVSVGPDRAQTIIRKPIWT